MGEGTLSIYIRGDMFIYKYRHSHTLPTGPNTKSMLLTPLGGYSCEYRATFPGPQISSLVKT